jgi:hypothetical protein
MPSEEFILRGIWKMEMGFCPSLNDPAFVDTVVLAETSGVGYCVCHDKNLKLPIDWIGRDVREITTSDRCLRVAILDAAYSALVFAPTYSLALLGSSNNKALGRASIISYEILRLVPKIARSSLNVAVVGAVGSILAELKKLGLSVRSTDMDSSVIGETLGGVKVEDGHGQTTSMLASADLALVTGMTISTNTLDDIFSVCRSNKTKLIMFIQTGSNFASEYLRRGADTVVAEIFPNYIFPGETVVKVFRRDEEEEGIWQ